MPSLKKKCAGLGSLGHRAAGELLAEGDVLRPWEDDGEHAAYPFAASFRVVEPDGRWGLVLPDPAEAVTHLWAEAATPSAAERLLDEWSAVVEAAHG